MAWKPRVVQVVLDGTNLSPDVSIPKGTRLVDINPRTKTVEVQVAFEGGLGNTAPEFIELVDGQPYSLKLNELPGGAPEAFKLSFFAAVAVTVDVVYF